MIAEYGLTLGNTIEALIDSFFILVRSIDKIHILIVLVAVFLFFILIKR